MTFTNEAINQRLLRFDNLIPCTTAFIDARTPGSNKKENFCIIGSGVSENPGQVVHIDVPHSFNVGGAKQPKGCKNSHHSHDTEEVFFVHKGEWLINWGEHGTDGEVIIKQGDIISIPTQLFRGFENIGCDDGFLLSVLGIGKDGTPGTVIWAPYVFEKAKSHGMLLLDDGRLLDLTAGDSVPEGAREEQPPSLSVIQSFREMSVNDMQACVCTQEEVDAFNIERGGHSQLVGIKEIPLIGVKNANESIAAGKIDWSHNFHVRRLLISERAEIDSHSRAEEEVIFIHQGSLEINIEGQKLLLNKGDLITIPCDANRSFKNNTSHLVDAVVVRGGDNPSGAKFID